MDMEREIGYKVDESYSDEGVKRFYTDLSPGFNSVYERTEKESEEHKRKRLYGDENILDEVLPDLGVPQVRQPHIGAYEADTLLENCTRSGHSDFHT